MEKLVVLQKSIQEFFKNISEIQNPNSLKSIQIKTSEVMTVWQKKSRKIHRAKAAVEDFQPYSENEFNFV